MEEAVAVAAFFALGGLWFWLLAAIFVAAIFSSVAYENGILATIFVVFWAGLILLWGDINFLTLAKNNGWYILGYFIGGILNAYFEWSFIAADHREELKQMVHNFLRSHNKSDTQQIPEDLQPQWRKYFNDNKYNLSNYRYHRATNPAELSAWEHRKEIVRTMVYWPFVLLIRIFSDLIKRLFEFLFRPLQKSFQWLADLVVGDVVKQFQFSPDAPQEPEPQDEVSDVFRQRRHRR